MKDRAVWAFVVFAVLVLGGIYLLRVRPATTSRPTAPPPAPMTVQPAPSVPSSAPAAPAAAIPTPLADAKLKPGPETPMIQLGRGGVKVPVQDGKTIDMSSGRPVVVDNARSRAAIEKSVKEMEAAAQEVTFTTTPGSVPRKQPEPAPAAPKP